MMRYTVVFERTSTGYSVYVPVLPGCVSTGRTKREACRNIQEAIALHLEGLREDGADIPDDATVDVRAVAVRRPRAA